MAILLCLRGYYYRHLYFHAVLLPRGKIQFEICIMNNNNIQTAGLTLEEIGRSFGDTVEVELYAEDKSIASAQHEETVDI
jgi:hypothetical protein